jgi:hypothetical protein
MNLNEIKFLFGLGAGGVSALATVIFIGSGDTGLAILFLFISLIASFFLVGATTSACAIYVIGAFIFAMMAKAGEMGYGCMWGSIASFLLVILIGVIGYNYVTSSQ